MDEIMTVPQVATYLKLSKSKVYYLVQTGQIRHIRIGRSVRIRETDIQEWIMDQMTHDAPGIGPQTGAEAHSKIRRQ